MYGSMVVFNMGKQLVAPIRDGLREGMDAEMGQSISAWAAVHGGRAMGHTAGVRNSGVHHEVFELSNVPIA